MRFEADSTFVTKLFRALSLREALVQRVIQGEGGREGEIESGI